MKLLSQRSSSKFPVNNLHRHFPRDAVSSMLMQIDTAVIMSMCARLNENVNKSFRQQSKMSSSTVIKVVVILCILCLSYQVYAELIF